MFVRRFLPAFATITCGSLAMAADASLEELKAQLNALQQKIQTLEAQQEAQAKAQVTLQQVVSDADRRSELPRPEQFTAGYRNGRFTIASEDGNFSLYPTAQFQFRYAGSYQDADGGSVYDDGFELRRMKLGIAGNLLAKDLTYKFQWATDRGNGNMRLEDGWIRYCLGKNFSIVAGQFEDLTSHEALVSSSRQLATEQSYANRVLVDSLSEYVQGVGITYSTGKLRVSAAFSDGAGSANTGWRDQSLGASPAPGAPAAFSTIRYATSARAEFLLMGDNWKAYDDFTARGNKDDLLVLGGGVHRSEGTDGELYLYALDLQWEPHAIPGLGVYVAALGNTFDLKDGTSANNYGYVVQAGYMLNDKTEIFGRWDMVQWDKDVFAAGGKDRVHEYTVGVNYYISGHNAKLTADVVYLPDGAPSGQSGLNIVGQDSDDTQVVGRVQFQLLL